MIYILQGNVATRFRCGGTSDCDFITNLLLSPLCKDFYKCSGVAEMGDRLAAIDIGRKLGGSAPFGGELGPHVTQCGLGQSLPSHQVDLDPSSHLVTTDMGQK